MKEIVTKKKRVKKKIVKFLEIDQLQGLQEPLIKKAKIAIAKNPNMMLPKDIIAIRDFTALSLIYACALRITELCNLKMHNLNLDMKNIRIIDSKGDDRDVPLPEPIIKILKEWLAIRPNWKGNDYVFCNVKGSTRPNEQAKPLRRQYFNILIYKLAEATGVKMNGGKELVKPHPHTLRHTRAMSWRDNGTELDVIQQLLGHKDLRTTQVYAHARQEQLEKVQQENTKGIMEL